MDTDQITTIIIWILSSNIFIEAIKYLFNRRKAKLEIGKQRLDIAETVQDVYEQFVKDTKIRLDELCTEVNELSANNDKLEKEIEALRSKNDKLEDEVATLRGRVKTLEDEKARLLAENAQLKKQK